MASLLFYGIASAVASSIGLTGIFATLFTGAAAIAGAYFIDSKLFGPGAQNQSFDQEGPRLDSDQLTVLSSTEGSSIIRGFGRFKAAGEVIWATRLEEVITTTTETQSSGGGKGGGGGGGGTVTTTTTTYSYFANFAIGICEGPVGRLNRVWADGKLLDLKQYTYRFYNGSEDQTADSLIVSKMGTSDVPAYRGTAYIVFERMPLEHFGNRIPQLSFEIINPVPGSLAEESVRGVNIIPGATEFGYEPNVVSQQFIYQGRVTGGQIENTHLTTGESDWKASIDHLQAVLPNLETVCLVVGWFGDDLRCGNCTIRPKVETDNKETSPYSWQVAGLTRSTALIMSQVDGRPAYGGSPNEASVIRAIQDLQARGLRVMYYPFILMDVASDNVLPNPYSDNAATNGQPAYPWRGRITCSPAAGFAGTVDKTATAATQIAAFVGTAAPSDFGGSGTTVTYSGPDEWSYRRFILHHAKIAALAGGVHQFCIGSEMVGLTRVRSSSGDGTYPFVDALVTLASDVAGMLPGVEIGYAADWSEWCNHRPDDGSGDVIFNMDPLWSSDDIDFIGIDWYPPMTDWRDGIGHLDYEEGYLSIYNIDYLKSRIQGGEYFDWFYASDSDRANQVRTDLTDNDPANEPWIYGNKRLVDWWSNEHHSRPGGVRNAGATSWVPESKKIVFTEMGVPAIDKGTNQPNVFFDPKSSESEVPYFSSAARDDVIQRQGVRAFMEYWLDNANNPSSSVYAGRMVDVASTNIWSWDARPFPSFPYDSTSWADADNWKYGHWINSRFGTVSVPDLLAAISDSYGFTAYDYTRAYATCDGYVLDHTMSLRDAFQPLMLVFFFDLIESGDIIKAVSKYEMQNVLTVDLDNVWDQQSDSEPKELAQFTRKMETDLPLSAVMRYPDIEKDYEQGSAEARRLVVNSDRVSEANVPIVYDLERAISLVERWLYSLWAERETAAFGVLPSRIELEPGDVVTVQVNQFSQEVRIITVRDQIGRMIEAHSFDRSAFEGPVSGPRVIPPPPTDLQQAPIVYLMDLPMLLDTDSEIAGYAAAYTKPWPGGVNIFRSPSGANYQLNTVLSGPAVLGVTRFDFYSGPTGRYDRANSLYVRLDGGELSSTDELSLLAGANACAIENADGEWEVLQFQTATLTASLEYTLSKLLRGQRGTEYAMRDPVAAGARVVFFNIATVQVAMQPADIGIEYFFKYGPANQDIGSALYSVEQYTYTGRGRAPYSPTQVRGLRDSGTGDWTLSWLRRTRIDGDNWGYVTDVPLNEDSESYEVDILDNLGAVLRTLTSSTPSVTYSAADQTTDFGSPQTQFDVIVYQLSATYGRGTGRRATIFQTRFT